MGTGLIIQSSGDPRSTPRYHLFFLFSVLCALKPEMYFSVHHSCIVTRNDSF